MSLQAQINIVFLVILGERGAGARAAPLPPTIQKNYINQSLIIYPKFPVINSKSKS